MKQRLIRIILFCALFFCGTIPLPAQQFKWAQGGGSTASGITSFDQEEVHYMCTDANGNIYAASQVGYSDITVDTFFMAMAYVASNIMVTSYTCNGQLRWAKLITTTGGGGGYGCIPSGLVADGLGHIYVAGVIPAATLYIGFDTTITGLPDDLTGIIQLDTTGHFNWIQYIGNNTLSTFIATGYYQGALTMDNANNVHFLPAIGDGVVLMPGDTSHYGVYDIAYDATGSLLSATRLGFDSTWAVNSAVIDPATNKLYVSGQSFAAAFDAGRSLLWQYFCGSYENLFDVVLDQSKHLYFCGVAQPPSPSSFTGIFTFNGDTVSSPGFFNMSIIMKTDTNGIPDWITHYDSHTGVDAFLSIILLPNNKVAAAGTYAESVTDVGIAAISTPAGRLSKEYKNIPPTL